MQTDQKSRWTQGSRDSRLASPRSSASSQSPTRSFMSLADTPEKPSPNKCGASPASSGFVSGTELTAKGASVDSASPARNLRHPSERRPSKLFLDDDFDCSVNVKGNHPVTKTLKAHLERIPGESITSPQHMPMLQPYTFDPTDSAASSDTDSAPPPLVPEVTVTKSQQQKTSDILNNARIKLTKQIADDSYENLPSLAEEEVNKRHGTNKFKLGLDLEGDSDLNDLVKGTSSLSSVSVASPFSDQEKHSPEQQLYEEDHAGSDIVSDSEWSESLEGLFQEPERISTGKEEKVTIDGVDFLSFESKEDLLEFTAMDVDYINSYKTVDIEELSRNHQPIIPTKTKDITKIKGWRNKLFAGHNYTVENETTTLKSNETGKETVSSSSKLHVSSDSNKVVHSVTDKDIVKNNLQEKSTKSDGNSSLRVEDGKKCSPNTLHSDSAHSNLDESWVKFAVSALVLPSPGEAGKSSERNTACRSEEGEPCSSEEEIKRRGRPMLFPLSRYMQKKLGTEVKQRKTPKPQTVVESNRKIMQSVKNTVKSLVQNVEANEVTDSKFIETSDVCKEKTSRELKKLGHVVIDIENKLKSPNAKSSADESNCTEEFCKLGCVCASLDAVPRPLGHCGKVDCMFECTCTTLPHVAVERMIEDEKRDLAPAEKEFRNTLIRADNGIMMVKERGRREIKLPGRFRSEDVLVGEALSAIEHKVFRSRGPSKSKTFKESAEEPQSIETKCEETVRRERKSLLKEIRNVPSKKSYDLNTSIPIPSPEILIDPHSDETFDLEFGNDAPKSSLYDNEGGFIPLDMEEKFLASQGVKIKQEKMDEADDDGTIEIDDMGWQSYIPELTDDKTPSELLADDFGKIVDIKSVALEEFCNDIPSTSGTADTPVEKSSIEEESQPSTSTVQETPVDCPIDKRKAAKLRAKRLAEFFTTNANVSSLVKSAFVFNPSVLQKEAITLLQWCSLKERYKERSIQLWIKNTQRDFHFLVTESTDVPSSPEYTNLWDYEITESSDVPEVVKQMQQDDASSSDYQRCCILWCNGKNWEFIGTLLKNKPNISPPVNMIQPSSKPKALHNHTNLPKELIETKWYSIALKSDFESIRLLNENVLISYTKINQVIGAAWRFKKTMFLEMTRVPASDFDFKSPFGLYARPNEYKIVYIGPYTIDDDAILEFVPYEKVVCKSSISELFLEPLGTRRLITPPVASFTEPELVIVPNRRVSLESRTSCSSTDYRSDESPKRPEVTSSGRVRKVPKYLIQECEDDSKPSENRGRKRKIPQHLMDCETPTIAKGSEKRPREKSESPATKKARQLETFSRNMEDVFNDVLNNHCTQVKIKQEVVTSDEELSEDSLPLLERLRRRREEAAAAQTKNKSPEVKRRRITNSDKVNKILAQEGTLGELVCHYESLKAIPVVVYSNGSVRMRNPFGKRVAHFENLDLAKRFLNFVFNKAVKGTALTWTIQPWSGCQEKGQLIQETLQTARARVTPLRLLTMAIGDEGRTRPVRVKWKPHKKKDRSAIQRVIDECEKNGAFNSTEMALLMASAASARSWQPERPQETEKDTPTKSKKTPEKIKMERTETRDETALTVEELASTSINSYAELMASTSKTEQKRDTEERVHTVGPPVMDEDTIEMMFNPRLGKNHRDMEKIRRKELAHRFKILASLLVPVDMLNRCSKIMVLQRSVHEVGRLKRRGEKLKARRLNLEKTRDQLLQSFSKCIEGMDKQARIQAVLNLKNMLDVKPQHTEEAKTLPPVPAVPEYTFSSSDEAEPVVDCFYATPMLPRKPMEVKPKLAPKPTQKRPVDMTAEERAAIAVANFEKRQKLKEDAEKRKGEQQVKEKKEANGESSSATANHPPGAWENSAEPPPLVEITKKVPPTVRTAPLLYPLHKIQSAEESGSGESKSNLPCHVRISKNGKLFLPNLQNMSKSLLNANNPGARTMIVATATKANGGRFLALHPSPTTNGTPDLVDLSDGEEGSRNKEPQSTKPTRVSSETPMEPEVNGDLPAPSVQKLSMSVLPPLVAIGSPAASKVSVESSSNDEPARHKASLPCKWDTKKIISPDVVPVESNNSYGILFGRHEVSLLPKWKTKKIASSDVDMENEDTEDKASNTKPRVLQQNNEKPVFKNMMYKFKVKKDEAQNAGQKTDQPDDFYNEYKAALLASQIKYKKQSITPLVRSNKPRPIKPKPSTEKSIPESSEPSVAPESSKGEESTNDVECSVVLEKPAKAVSSKPAAESTTSSPSANGTTPPVAKQQIEPPKFTINRELMRAKINAAKMKSLSGSPITPLKQGEPAVSNTVTPSTTVSSAVVASTTASPMVTSTTVSSSSIPTTTIKSSTHKNPSVIVSSVLIPSTTVSSTNNMSPSVTVPSSLSPSGAPYLIPAMTVASGIIPSMIVYPSVKPSATVCSTVNSSPTVSTNKPQLKVSSVIIPSATGPTVMTSTTVCGDFSPTASTILSPLKLSPFIIPSATGSSVIPSATVCPTIDSSPTVSTSSPPLKGSSVDIASATVAAMMPKLTECPNNTMD